MTTIIGIQGDGYSVVVADTRISSFDESGSAYQISTLGTGSTKMAANGKYFLGAAGDMRAINILHHVFRPPDPPIDGDPRKLDAFITGKFIPTLRACFDNQGYSPPDGKDKEHSAEQGSSIVVMVNASIYLIENDYSWTSEASGLYVTGTGAPYALGALQALISGKELTLQQAKRTALKAIAIASKFDPYTGAPFHANYQETDK